MSARVAISAWNISKLSVKMLKDVGNEGSKMLKDVGNEGSKMLKDVGNEGSKILKDVGNEGSKNVEGMKTVNNTITEIHYVSKQNWYMYKERVLTIRRWLDTIFDVVDSKVKFRL